MIGDLCSVCGAVATELIPAGWAITRDHRGLLYFCRDHVGVSETFVPPKTRRTQTTSAVVAERDALRAEVERLRADLAAEKHYHETTREHHDASMRAILEALGEKADPEDPEATRAKWVSLAAAKLRAEVERLSRPASDRVGDYPMGPGWGVLASGEGEGE